jgi:hypothetical protein
MDKIQAVMHYQIFSIQLWVYLVLVVLPFGVNEIVQRSKSTVAMSLFQFVMRIVLMLPAAGALLSAIPGLGDALHKMAGDTTGLPPTSKQRRAAKKAAKPAEAPKAADAAITTTTTTEVPK